MKVIPADVSGFLQQYFDKILVISTHRFTDRQQTIQQNLQGLPFEYSWGTDKLTISMGQVKQQKIYDEKRSVQLHRFGKPMHLGEVACALSHRTVYEEMIRHNWQKVFIMEDDALPIYENLHLLPEALQELPTGWDVLYLGYLKHETVTPALKRKQFFYKIISALGLTRWDYTMMKNLLPKPFGVHLRKAGFHDCAHAYAVSLEGAKKMLAAQTPVVYRADDVLSYSILKGKLNGYVTEPKFFDQVDFHTAVNSKIKS